MTIDSDIYPISAIRAGDGRLEIGGVACDDLADQFGTPLYVIDGETVQKNSQIYTQFFESRGLQAKVFYAGKANANIGLFKRLHQLGLGIDVVSAGELYTAIKAGISGADILFHGNNKSQEELELAIEHQVLVVVDNREEWARIGQICSDKGTQARVMLRLKPGIEAHTHHAVQTGQETSKFGMTLESGLACLNAKPDRLLFEGIHGHIGSQIFDAAPYKQLAETLVGFMKTIKSETQLDCSWVNLGGGWGIKYVADDRLSTPAQYLTAMLDQFEQSLKDSGLEMPQLMVEPGRSIVGQAGIILYSVGSVKPSGRKTYLFVDGGMGDNARPQLYASRYTVTNVSRSDDDHKQSYAIAGPFCESGDELVEPAMLTETEVGDRLAILGAGAYTYSMASFYNRRARPAMIWVASGATDLLVWRDTFSDLVQNDQI